MTVDDSILGTPEDALTLTARLNDAPDAKPFLSPAFKYLTPQDDSDGTARADSSGSATYMHGVQPFGPAHMRSGVQPFGFKGVIITVNGRAYGRDETMIVDGGSPSDIAGVSDGAGFGPAYLSGVKTGSPLVYRAGIRTGSDKI